MNYLQINTTAAMQGEDEGFPVGGSWTAGIHPQSIPGALKVQQESIGLLQRTLRQELAKLQAEEAILKLMIRRERRRLARQARRREGTREPDAPLQQEGGRAEAEA
ncbi:hypothetical protein PLESTB_001018400 [Pleodorina starrii]|uniref:Uncharacterized protein n=1 Tax=Pleodorina starrii TaxID=330485 RepID=A0A9W6BPA1_9CHLO|nr:hypothetical protein PLESTB_001018400 [Pleodorina starrii]